MLRCPVRWRLMVRNGPQLCRLCDGVDATLWKLSPHLAKETVAIIASSFRVFRPFSARSGTHQRTRTVARMPGLGAERIL